MGSTWTCPKCGADVLGSRCEKCGVTDYGGWRIDDSTLRAARLASARDAVVAAAKEWYADRYEDPHGVALGILEEAVRALLAAEGE